MGRGREEGGRGRGNMFAQYRGSLATSPFSLMACRRLSQMPSLSTPVVSEVSRKRHCINCRSGFLGRPSSSIPSKGIVLARADLHVAIFLHL